MTVLFKFITKCDKCYYKVKKLDILYTKCGSFLITKCDNFITKCDRTVSEVLSERKKGRHYTGDTSIQREFSGRDKKA